ncbi:hypothetical protein R1flu_015281 [Riccia fluitans]|uniref:Uncharacterized protein n=1 Tax=Riccia fluitans TaxID=41844 RepID=A0ABD1YJA9_9MARC
MTLESHAAVFLLIQTRVARAPDVHSEALRACSGVRAIPQGLSLILRVPCRSGLARLGSNTMVRVIEREVRTGRPMHSPAHSGLLIARPCRRGAGCVGNFQVESPEHWLPRGEAIMEALEMPMKGS